MKVELNIKVVKSDGDYDIYINNEYLDCFNQDIKMSSDAQTMLEYILGRDFETIEIYLIENCLEEK